MQSVSCENEFDVDENEPVSGTHFDINGLPQGLPVALAQRQKTTEVQNSIFMSSSLLS